MDLILQREDTGKCEHFICGVCVYKLCAGEECTLEEYSMGPRNWLAHVAKSLDAMPAQVWTVYIIVDTTKLWKIGILVCSATAFLVKKDLARRPNCCLAALARRDTSRACWCLVRTHVPKCLYWWQTCMVNTWWSAVHRMVFSVAWSSCFIALAPLPMMLHNNSVLPLSKLTSSPRHPAACVNAWMLSWDEGCDHWTLHEAALHSR